MSLFRTAGGCARVLLIGVTLLAGCTSGGRRSVTISSTAPAVGNAPTATSATESEVAAAATSHVVTTVSHNAGNASEPPALLTGDDPLATGDDPFAGQAELSLPRLVAEVQQRNPSLQAALAAWSAAAERYPQVVALDDPIFQSSYAPATFVKSSPTQSSYSLGVAQRIPWSGKLQLRGQVANWETVATSLDFQDSQLRIAEMTRLSFFDYYLVHRELELNAANAKALGEFRDTARQKYEANLVTQQDVLQAEVELAKLAQERIDLKQMDQVTIARINTLLHRIPDHSLPPPPQQLEVQVELPAVEQLRQIAVDQRPDLASQAARLHAEQNAVALGGKEFYPDFEFMGRYDSFWTDREQRPQVGMNMNVPLNQTRRRAAVREAMFRVSKLQAEYDQQVDNIRNDVQAGYARVDASKQTVALYVDRILPTATSNVSAALTGYTTGRVDFLRLIDAQRELIYLQSKHQQAIADYHRRRAELERVVGTALPPE